MAYSHPVQSSGLSGSHGLGGLLQARPTGSQARQKLHIAPPHAAETSMIHMSREPDMGLI